MVTHNQQWQMIELYFGLKLNEDSRNNISSHENDQEVITSAGRRVAYSHLVLCSGPWTNRLLDIAGLRLLPLGEIKGQEKAKGNLEKQIQEE